jgi:hypothetical protein
MILSKLTTANSRLAIAAPEIKARATMRSRLAVFFTVAGDTSAGRVYATGIAACDLPCLVDLATEMEDWQRFMVQVYQAVEVHHGQRVHSKNRLPRFSYCATSDLISRVANAEVHLSLELDFDLGLTPWRCNISDAHHSCVYPINTPVSRRIYLLGNTQLNPIVSGTQIVTEA